MNNSQDDLGQISRLFGLSQTVQALLRYRARMKRNSRSLEYRSLPVLITQVEKCYVDIKDLHAGVAALVQLEYVRRSGTKMIWEKSPAEFTRLLEKLDKDRTDGVAAGSEFKHSEIAVRQITCEFSSGRKVTVSLRQDLTPLERKQLVEWFTSQVAR